MTSVGPTCTVSEGWRAGAIGDVAGCHARYYAAAWGFGAYFEIKVASELAAFVDRYDPARDLLLTAYEADRFLGSIVIDGSDPELPPGHGHLRWFIMSDEARGRGVGGALMARAMAFLEGAGFASCYLTTFAGLDAARRLYERHGFRLVSEQAAQSWGTEVREQRFERDPPV